MGPTAAGFGTEAPSLFICMMVCIIRRVGRLFCVSSDVVVDWLAPVMIVAKTSSMIGDGFEARHFEEGTGWPRRSGLERVKVEFGCS